MASYYDGCRQLDWPREEAPIGNYLHVFGHTESTILALFNAFVMNPGVSDHFNPTVTPYIDASTDKLSCVKEWVAECLCSLVDDPTMHEDSTGSGST